jgi:hypothetical protein
MKCSTAHHPSVDRTRKGQKYEVELGIRLRALITYMKVER